MKNAQIFNVREAQSERLLALGQVVVDDGDDEVRRSGVSRDGGLPRSHAVVFSCRGAGRVCPIEDDSPRAKSTHRQTGYQMTAFRHRLPVERIDRVNDPCDERGPCGYEDRVDRIADSDREGLFPFFYHVVAQGNFHFLLKLAGRKGGCAARRGVVRPCCCRAVRGGIIHCNFFFTRLRNEERDYHGPFVFLNRAHRLKDVHRRQGIIIYDGAGR